MCLEAKLGFFTASYFSSGEIHMESHTLRSPLLTFLKNQCPSSGGAETENAPGGLWCPKQPV